MHEKNKRLLLLALAGLMTFVIAGLIVLDKQGQSAAVSKPVVSAVPADVGTSTLSSSSYSSEGLVITELMGKNRATIADADVAFTDWIELHNSSSAPISLSGFSLSDGEDKQPWYFPAVELEAGGYLLVFASNKSSYSSELHADFALSAGETVYLCGRDGTVIFTAPVGEADADVSMALVAEGTWAECHTPSPGFTNTAEGYESFMSTREPLGALAIYEVMPLNVACYNAGPYGYADWVELKNISSDSISLSDYYISDDSDEPNKHRLPKGSLAPGESVLIICDEEASPNSYLPLAPFGLDSDSDRLFVTGKDGLSDYISFSSIPYECSYGRADGEKGFFYFPSPTPKANNGEHFRRISATPLALTTDGVFEGVDSVRIEVSGEGMLRYTLDGSLPTEDSNEYSSAVTIDKSSVFRVRSFEEGCMPSRPLTLRYFINEGHSLPVVSLDAYDIRSFRNMYFSGNKATELPVTLSFYRDGESFSIDCGAEMHGETSLILPKKNVSLRFRGTYGQKSLSHDIFGGGMTEFSDLLLRSGQDQEYAMLRNELSQKLCGIAEANVVNQRSVFCALYINGEYSGLYSLMEKSNSRLYASLAGVKPGSVSVETSPLLSDSPFLNDVISFARKNDLSRADNYKKFCDMVDIDSLIDWHIMEGYCTNSDVGIGNVRFCRSSENDGKWRFMFYDLDASFGSNDSMYKILMTDYSYDTFQVSGMVVKLMKNKDFKDRFLSRAAELLSNKLTDETLLSEFDAMCSLIEPEVKLEYKRLYGTSEDAWRESTARLRSALSTTSWRQRNINSLCDVFSLNAAERERYFGAIDGK